MRFSLSSGRSSLALLLVPAACALYACSSETEDATTTETPDGSVTPTPTVTGTGTVTPPTGDDDDDDDDDDASSVKDASSDAKKGDGAVFDSSVTDTGVDANDGALVDSGVTDTGAGFDANDGSDGNFGWPLDASGFTLERNVGTFVDGLQWLPAKGVLIYAEPFAGFVDSLVPDGGATTNVVTGVVGPLGNALGGPDGGYLFTGVAGKTGSGGQTGKVRATPVNGGGGSDTPFKRGDGTGFNQPNDLEFRSDGILYTTDPGFFSPGGTVTGVYRHFTDGGTATSGNQTSIAGLHYNGIALSPDEKTLYVSVTDFFGGSPTNTSFIQRYTVAADGSLTLGANLVTGTDGVPLIAADGLAVDDGGNVYVCTSAGLRVYSSTGVLRVTIDLPGGAGAATSVAFGGGDRKTIFVATENGRIYRVRGNIPGRL